MHVSGLWEDAGVPAEIMHSAQEGPRLDLNPLWGNSTNHHATLCTTDMITYCVIIAAWVTRGGVEFRCVNYRENR